MVIAILERGFNIKLTGSEITVVPGSIIVSTLLSNLSVCSVDLSIMPFPVETAIRADFIVTGLGHIHWKTLP
jgi:hypothetical protein